MGAALFAAILAACSSAPVSSAPTSASCASPSQKVEDPTSVTSAGFSVEGTPSSLPSPIGGPTKVLIHPVEPFDQPITLAGARCVDGHPLRFWYGPAHQGTPFSLGPRSTAVPEGALAQTGDLETLIEPAQKGWSSCGAGLDYTGYMLFTTTGTWRVRAQSAGRQIGEVVVLVGAP